MKAFGNSSQRPLPIHVDRKLKCFDDSFLLFYFNGPFSASFYLFLPFQHLMVDLFILKFCQRLNSNRRLVVLEVTAERDLRLKQDLICACFCGLGRYL